MDKFAGFFTMIQKACLPGVWSKGVSLARQGAVHPSTMRSADLSANAQSPLESEWTFSVQIQNHPVSPKVTLWPADSDWYCDCEDRNEVCPHVAAVVIACKSGVLDAVPAASIASEGPPVLQKASSAGHVSYRFVRQNGKLAFDRWIVFGSDSSQAERLKDSLVAHMGGIQSGRISSRPIVATREDYAVDATFVAGHPMDRAAYLELFPLLARCSSIFLDGQPIAVSAQPYKIQAELIEEHRGFRLKQSEVESPDEIFSNGVVRCKNTLKSVVIPNLSMEERQLLAGKGSFFDESQVTQIKKLVLEILPALQKKMTVLIHSKKLPQIQEASIRIALQLESTRDGRTLTVIPTFKTTPLAVKNAPPNPHPVILRTDPKEEARWIRKLQTELQLSPGQQIHLQGEEAVDFLLRTSAWEKMGPGVEKWSIHSELLPSISFEGGNLSVGFQVGQTFSTAANSLQGTADAREVFRAWRENRNYVPLLGGGWAALPKDWLARYADRVEELFAWKVSQKKSDQGSSPFPRYLIPELVELQSTLSEAPNLANQASLNISKELQNLVAQLSDIQSIPQAKLPEDLHASLRPYQTQGVNWLCFLRDQKMGAMLADDMGLGKTLQTLCAIRGKTLVISPTSVLFAWAKQIDLFRPNLKYSIYYGSQRKFDLNLQDDLQGTPQVLLTTYAILRLDLAILNRHKWDTIVIDEAQIIKNSASQVTQAVHALQGDFKIALSGTPLENRLEDLWSQFQFINPGLLGQLESFQERYVEPISRGGDSQAAVHATQRLRARVRPFLLRRLKQEVATDLPPRTDKVLHCELSAQERELYQALLASTRSEILEKLEAGGSIFSALELLLRLRQACCHGSLIPGQSFQRSSKIELLVSTLLESIACGHRALVFSQWTSYLDLIEPHLSAAHISYSRLDGSTPNRDEVVNDFQKPSGPAVLLLSLKAGGVGLTLTAADHIFLMDPWWNPAVEDQAADRAHRIGQTQSVLIHRLVARETLEEGILELQLQKRKMAASVLDESIPKQSPLQSAGHAMQSISREELIGLLAL